MKKLTLLGFVVALLSTAAFAQQAVQVDEETANRYIELVRSDINRDRVALIGQAMAFSADESATFWPIYNEFEAELNQLGDARVALIRDYAANFTMMTDAKALELGQRSLELESQRTALRQSYFDRISAEMSPVIAARFLQVDRQLQMLLDLQIASELPLIQRPQ
jgi:hypothetical protein